jgi:membrane protein YqaA with SNARE-associated domain
VLDQLQLFCQELGLPGLVLLSFLAATLVPLGSEWLLVVLLSAARDDLGHQALLVLMATAGNTAGGLVTYYMALGGMRLADGDVVGRHFRLHAWVKRLGGPASFFTWLPWIGEPIGLLAGALKVPLLTFLGWSTSGRLMRYALIWLIMGMLT